MKARYCVAVIVAALFLSLPMSARAEIKAGSVELGLFGGYNFFESKQNLENRPLIGARLGYNFTNRFGVEGVMEYIDTRVDDSSILGSKEGEYRGELDDIDILFYHIDAVLHFMPERDFNPFILVGFGGAAYSPQISDSDMSAFNIGVGAKYWLSENVALRGDIRNYMVSEIFDWNYNNLAATVGLTIAFAGDREPAAAAPAAKDTTAPEVASTRPDGGASDVQAYTNITATFSEEMDTATINTSTFMVKQGTKPVSGRVTSAGKVATFDPSGALENGKIYTATVTTGTKDLAGNALPRNHAWSFTTIEGAKDEKEVFIPLEDTHFVFDSSDISENGKAILKRNIQTMKDNPKMRVRIAGYTSASGTDEYNQKLSERRASKVKAYIVSEGGIDQRRLTTIGYGENYPAEHESVPSRKHSDAAKANMRVLFEIIVK